MRDRQRPSTLPAVSGSVLAFALVAALTTQSWPMVAGLGTGLAAAVSVVVWRRLRSRSRDTHGLKR